MIAVMGASGNTGGRISEQLLQQGEEMRALGRSSERLAGLEGKIKSREGRRPENTTPTRFEDFAQDLARAYQAA
jgi:uncharacterized protein YbjT (DUF2867 family)